MEKVGRITHYFTNIGVGAIELTNDLKVGDKVRIKGATTDFEQVVESMQIENEDVQEAKAGDGVGMEVKKRVREGDEVYKIS